MVHRVSHRLGETCETDRRERVATGAGKGVGIRQCGPERLYGRASDIYQGGETEPSHADRAVLAAGSYWTPSTKKATVE